MAGAEAAEPSQFETVLPANERSDWVAAVHHPPARVRDHGIVRLTHQSRPRLRGRRQRRGQLRRGSHYRGREPEEAQDAAGEPRVMAAPQAQGQRLTALGLRRGRDSCGLRRAEGQNEDRPPESCSDSDVAVSHIPFSLGSHISLACHVCVTRGPM